MFKQKLCLSTSPSFRISTEEQILLFKKAGFEAFFTMWDENVDKYKKFADEIGMIYQSIHAPFMKAQKMWTEDALDAVEELIKCVEDCYKINVPILVIHPYKGFDGVENPTECGIENFRKVVIKAKELGVKIAFENVEGESYLEALMKEFSEFDNVGFCWDSGHEQCYNRGKDMLEIYGNKLIATHINDNLGVSDFDGKIAPTDDLHLLPYDGVTDWEKVAKRLNDCGYDGILTFELLKMSKKERHDNDKYMNMSIEEYIAECYNRACRLAYSKNYM